MGKWRVFALRAASSLIWGGWGFAVPFYFVQDCSKLRLHCRLAYPEVSVKAIRFKVFPTNEVIFWVQTRDFLINPQISKPFFRQFLICWQCIEENAILVSLYFFVKTIWCRTGSASENHCGWRSCRVICHLHAAITSPPSCFQGPLWRRSDVPYSLMPRLFKKMAAPRKFVKQ